MINKMDVIAAVYRLRREAVEKGHTWDGGYLGALRDIEEAVREMPEDRSADVQREAMALTHGALVRIADEVQRAIERMEAAGGGQ